MKNKSKVVFANSILATVYILYIVIKYGEYLLDNFKLFIEILNQGASLSLASATIIVPIFGIFLFIGMVLSWVGFFTNKKVLVLLSAIMFLLGPLSILAFSIYALEYSKILFVTFLTSFFVYLICCSPLIILGFIGYDKVKRI